MFNIQKQEHLIPFDTFGFQQRIARVVLLGQKPVIDFTAYAKKLYIAYICIKRFRSNE